MLQTELTRKARILVVRVMILLLTGGICFASLEFVLERYYSEVQSGNWTTFHPMRGWGLVPGQFWVKPLRAVNKIGISINELGLRSHDLPIPQPNTKSIIVLGDSFVFAKESISEETFSGRLKKLLNDRNGGGFDVINAGVPGYGTAQELLLTRELSWQHHINPDMYLLMFFTNDTLDNLCLSYGDLTPEPVRPCFTLSADGRPELTSLPVNQPEFEDDTLVAARRQPRDLATISLARAWAEEWIQTKSGLVALLSRLGMTPRVERMPGLLNAWYQERVVAEGIPLTSALIAQMQEEIRNRGGQLVVSMVPSPFQVYPETYIPLLRESFPGNPMVDRFSADTQRPQRMVEEMCRKAGVPFQDLLPVFLEHRETSLFIPRDGHLTYTGHKLVSETLLPFVAEHISKTEQ